MTSEPEAVPTTPDPHEFTAKAVVAGLVLGVLFGSANAYLGLRVGLTVGTSIPIAILTVAAFRALAGAMGRSGILEHNLSQTIGSACSSCASGLIFTIPALYLWGRPPTYGAVVALGAAGGVLGALAMIPLRRILIVQAHGELPYPEGTACAEVLRAAEAGGARARGILQGLGVGALFKLCADALKIVPRDVAIALPGIPKGRVAIEPSAALLGIGWILGYRVAAIMVAGGLVASAVLIPLIAQFGENLASPMFPETAKRIADMTPGEIWSRYVRYIGAGAVAAAGIVTVIRSLPTMWRSFRATLGGAGGAGAAAVPREDRDLPASVVLGGYAAVVLALALVPGAIGEDAPFLHRLAGAAAVGVFAFFFATVASRIVGMIGTTSNPISGMTIVTLLGTSALLLALGVGGMAGQVLAITVGSVVCVAASMAGDMSQDLKTGYLVRATPRHQQVGELLGAVVGAPFIAATLMLLASQGTFGSADMPAPQATLMKTVVAGVMSRDLPWALVGTGAALALAAELIGAPSLAFAVGIYLPLSTMTPIFAGGVLRRLADARLGRTRAEGGVLFASGLVAGEGVLGVGIAAWAFFRGKPQGLGVAFSEHAALAVGLAAVAALGALLWASAARSGPRTTPRD